MKNQIDVLMKQVRILWIAVVALTLVLCACVVSVFSGKRRFSEIDVERINVVEKDGALKLVISNKARQHPGSMNGKDFDPREREAGMIFFNRDGDECGGLVYDNAGMICSFDKYKDDQIMQLQYMEQTGSRRRKYGLQLWTYGKEGAIKERYNRYMQLQQLKTDSQKNWALEQMRTDGLLAADRMFVGKNYEEEIGVFIKDTEGRPRIRIYIDKQDQPRLEFLDSVGKLIKPI